MAQSLAGKKVAVVATDGFEQVELTEPRRALMEAGATVHVIAPHDGAIQGFKHHDKADKIKVDRTLDEVSAEEYDALVLPGGALNPDALRTKPQAVSFIRAFFEAKKPVGAICHGPWTLVEADVVRGRKLTSWPSIKTDLKNAGASWVDEEVVVDSGLVTSRKPDDIPAFNRKIVEEFAEGRHAAQHAAE
ncbi:MAG TPA: type 1 glutamine amidotransferase domain-containing protein [Stellaceae bacterium]|nr:type 1 glutamine amidotransferase domain-containing protein [Stellaceae bacterium]